MAIFYKEVAEISRIIYKKLLGALLSVSPIAISIFFLMLIFVPFNLYLYLLFFASAILLTLGIGLFSLGAEVAMLPIGENMGTYLIKKQNLILIIIFVFLMGFLITITEPGVIVLTNQLGDAIPSTALIIAIAIGLGFLFMISVLRILFKIKLRYVLLIGYTLAFILVFFVPKEILPFAFDSGGATTGAMTVPFIMAFGVGIGSIRGDKGREDDSFGLVAICSMGPILAVLLLSAFYKPTSATIEAAIINFHSIQEILNAVGKELVIQVKTVFFMLVPIAVIFYIFNYFAFKFSKQKTLRITFGLIYTFFGLTFFLTGANVGFLPVGKILGATLAELSYNCVLIPVGAVFGLVAVLAEPSVYVLNKEVETISSGAISRKTMLVTISLSIAIAMGLAMLRIILGFSILWFIIPGYWIALILTFFVPDLFSAIAFDSGAVASGPLTATFLVAFGLGAAISLGNGDSSMIMSNAFGLITIVALTPLVTIQLLGLVYKYMEYKTKKKQKEALELVGEDDE